METWSAHHLFSHALQVHDRATAKSLHNYATILYSKGLPVVFTLTHLAQITGVSYRMLRQTVNRDREAANYRMYAVKKRSGGRRFIHSVSSDLLRVQRFINQEILQKAQPHPCSYAFHGAGGIKKCAQQHCGARWLFQYDLKDFFYDITEIDVYKTFCEMGYRNLLAFELARLCTTTLLPKFQKRLLYYDENDLLDRLNLEEEIPKLPYLGRHCYAGVLPQGAPTSPMLSNLATRELDDSINQYALENGFTYTRYADDITLSAVDDSTIRSIGQIHRSIVHRIRKARFRENEKKTRIAGPGSKKLVLGLLVNNDAPRLSRETYKRIDRHLYAAEKFGLEETAQHEKFDSAYGFFNHLAGLVAYVKDVDIKRWEVFSTRLANLRTPW